MAKAAKTTPAKKAPPAAPIVEAAPAAAVIVESVVTETTTESIGVGIQVDGQGLEPMTVAFEVTAKREGFRRAGRAWSKAPTRVEVADLTEAEQMAILSEPMLEVVALTA